MSIWIDLLFLHGHIATPRALESFLVPEAVPAVPIGGPDQPARGGGADPDESTRAPGRDESARRPDRAARDPEPRVVSFPSVVHHPFRAVGQLS